MDTDRSSTGKFGHKIETLKVFVIFLFICDLFLSAEEVQSLFVIGFMSVMFVVAIINGQRCVQEFGTDLTDNQIALFGVITMFSNFIKFRSSLTFCAWV